MESLNRMATELVDEALEFTEELRIGASEVGDGATVLDFGVEFDGGIEAGLLLAELQTAGLATVQSRTAAVAGAPLPHVELSTDHPGLALLGSQKAGWELSVDGFEGLGSGPARALVAEEPAYRELGYTDAFEFAVLAVEADRLPTAAVAEQVAERAGVDVEGVFLPTFPTASVVGSVAGAARAAEAAVFRLADLGYPLADVLTATGTAPVTPVAADEATAMARTTEAVAYGGQVHLTLAELPEEPEAVASTAADAYGEPFADIFAGADWDFGAVDPEIFAPAQVTLDVRGGPTRVVGEPRHDLLAESLAL